ncbi:metallophosphoesterase [Sphingomonas sp. HF-S4]|uniref:Metallophosphoesterase n=1 Tax=Sphingomonas agrestis TaxID=3080540 RepID=A0ABU3Y7U2_9SPHN|nr:metallophosphoesterase [Sphingomonas sp. HF-S4]MDV3457473.1 metallophosphoesterase [Sphingomonas sp. HF-S4]
MIGQLFRRRSVAPKLEGRIPAGQRVYAIGDIHGRLDLLDTLLLRIRSDDASRGAAQSRILFLGDLIDRGPSSAQVVDRALEMASGPGNCQFLLGNHEEVFLKAMDGDPKTLAFFIRIGGRETILSYGISEQEYRDADYPELHALLTQRVPASHIAFLKSFEDLIVVGDYAFVHAGVRPGQALADQHASDLRWIRRDFLDHTSGFEKIIVHGHTITDEVEVRPHRIGLDTGAYASGKLTAMGFEGGERWVLDTAK